MSIEKKLLDEALTKYEIQKDLDDKKRDAEIGEWIKQYVAGECRFEDLPMNAKIYLHRKFVEKEHSQVYKETKKDYDDLFVLVVGFTIFTMILFCC